MYEMLVPELIRQIPDIKQIYDINDSQADELDDAIVVLENNIFLETMNEAKIQRWERILNICSFDSDTLAERRFRIQSRVLERLPYSYRIIVRKLKALSPNGITIFVDNENEDVLVKVALQSKRMIDNVSELVDAMLPLNMTYTVMLMYNRWKMFEEKKWCDMQTLTWQQWREDVLE